MDDSILEPDVIARGKAVRREVLGDAYVDQSYDVDALSRP